MANLWDELDEDQRTELVNIHLSGSRKDNANLNRAKEQLANNPNLVMRLAEEAGINHAADAEMDDTAPDGDESDNVMDGQNEIDRAVNASIDDADMQETGSVTNQTEIPPPQEGEDMSAYVDRLMSMQEGKEVQVAGEYEDDRASALDLARKTRGMDDRTAQENLAKIRRHKASGGYTG